jgi:hypothetical protein
MVFNATFNKKALNTIKELPKRKIKETLSKFQNIP